MLTPLNSNLGIDLTQRPDAIQHTSLEYSDSGVSYDRFMVGVSASGQITVSCNGITETRGACEFIFVPKNTAVTIKSDYANLFVYTWS